MKNQADTTETSRKVLERFYKNIMTGNFEGLLSCLHQDIEIHEPEYLPYGGFYRGIEDTKNRLFLEAPKWLDMGAFKIEAIIADGDRVIGMFDTTMVGTGEPLKFAEDCIIRDEKIYKINIFIFDPTPIINAVKAGDKRT